MQTGQWSHLHRLGVGQTPGHHVYVPRRGPVVGEVALVELRLPPPEGLRARDPLQQLLRHLHPPPLGGRDLSSAHQRLPLVLRKDWGRS
jgi:hypothetical protein